MSEKIIKTAALLFRNTPHFRGKYRIGKLIEKLLNPQNTWQTPEFFIKLKNKSELFIDIRSNTHNIPFWTGKRDEEIIDLILKNSKQNWVVFDIGANIGYYTIPIAKKLSQMNGYVHAFEPLNNNFSSLKLSVEKNGTESNIVLNKFALGDFIGNIDIIKTEKGNSSNAVLSFNDSEYEKDLTKETIAIKTLDEYTPNVQRCDLIKVDIEGAEYFLIKGGLKFIEKYKPIIYGEFNAFFLKKFGYSVLDIWQLLKPLGYQAYVEDIVKKGTFTKIEIKQGLIDILFIPENNTEKHNWINN